MTRVRKRIKSFLSRILQCELGKANATKIIIQYPANVILTDWQIVLQLSWQSLENEI